MSIIADTLKRLQAQSTGASSESTDAPSARPIFNKGEGPGQHRKSSNNKFWIIGGGITLALVGLAFGAFWVGWHMDLGLGTQTQASTNTHVSIPSALQTQEPLLAESPSEGLTTNVSEDSIPPQTDSTEQSQASPDVKPTSKMIAPTPSQKAQAPTISEEKVGTGTSKTTIASLAFKNQDKTSPIDTQGETDQKEQSISLTSPLQQSASAKASTGPENLGGPTATDVLAVTLDEEEIIQPDDFVMTSRVQSDSPEATGRGPLPASIENNKAKAPPVPTRNISTAQQLHQARQLIQKGKYDEASTLLSPLFHNPPVDWQPWFWMGTALLGKGEMEQADQFFLSGLARNDKVPQLWIQRALVAQQRGNYQLAIHELRQAELLEGNLPHIHLNMGYAYEQLGNNRLANQYYGKFLKLSEGNPEYFPIRKKIFSRLTQSISSKPLTSSAKTASPES